MYSMHGSASAGWGKGAVDNLGNPASIFNPVPIPHCGPLFYPYCFYSKPRPVVFNWVQFCPCFQGLFGNVYKHFSCHNLEEHLVGRGVRNTAKCPTVHRTAATTKNDPTPNINSVEVEKLSAKKPLSFSSISLNYSEHCSLLIMITSKIPSQGQSYINRLC